MIKIDIKKSFKNFILDINLNLEAHKFYSIVGKSGSGKTTFLRVLSGLERSKGEIVVEKDIWQNENYFLPPQKREIGFVFQDLALFPNMSIIENLLYVDKNISLANRLLDIMEITHLKKRYPKNLSGGEAQRVAIARALMKKPKLLLLDEAFNALDFEIKHKIQNELLVLHKEFKLTTFMITHHYQDIAISDMVIKFKEGKIEKIIDKKEFLDKKIKTLVKVEGNKLIIENEEILTLIKDKEFIKIGINLDV